MRREALVALAVLAFATHARAEDSVDPASLRAEKLAADAAQHASEGDLQRAIDLYVEANQAQPSAVVACNIAVLEERLGAKERAIATYKQCAAAPDADDALLARARARIAALEAPPPAAERKPWPAMKTWAVVAGAAGVVALGIGSGFGLSAKSKNDEAAKSCAGDRCTDPAALTLTHDATSAAHGADVAFAVGAVLLAGGVVLWLLAPKTSSPRPPGVAF